MCQFITPRKLIKSLYRINNSDRLELSRKCENEMLLTRMILKSVIDFLSRTSNLRLEQLGTTEQSPNGKDSEQELEDNLVCDELRNPTVPARQIF